MAQSEERSASLQELAPARDRTCYRLFSLFLDQVNAGLVRVIETSSGRAVGNLILGGQESYDIFVRYDGINRGSGGEMYVPIAAVHQEAATRSSQ